MTTTPVALGTDACRALFPITNRNLNNGSFGMPAQETLLKRYQHNLAIDKEPEAFLRYDAPAVIRSSCAAISDYYLGCTAESTVTESIVLVDNVGDAFNVVARSLLCNPRLHRALHWTEGSPSGPAKLPKVVVFNRQYPMVLQSLRYHNARALDALGLWLEDESTAGNVDADTVRQATPPGVVSGYIEWSQVQLTTTMLQQEEVFITTVVEAVMAADALVMDHVCWSPSLVFPVRRVCEAIRRLEKEEGKGRRRLLVIDGAHSIGNVDLIELFDSNNNNKEGNDELGLPPFDAFFSNLHKWAMVPRHCAFLYLHPRCHRFVHPNIVSNFYMGDEHGHMGAKDVVCPTTSENWGSLAIPAPIDVTRRVTREFFWCGTRDFATYLTVQDAIQFRRDVLGGEKAIQTYVSQLAYEGAKIVAQAWGTELIIEDPTRLCAMASVYCPTAIISEPQLQALLQTLLREHNTFAAWGELEGKFFVRLSGQVYLNVADFEFFAAKFLEVLQSKH